MTLAEDIDLKDLKTVMKQRVTAPLSVTLSGPGVVDGVPAKDVVKMIRNVEKLLLAVNAEVNPGARIEVRVKGIDNAGEAFTVRFEMAEKAKKR